MSANFNNIRSAFSDQLASFESQREGSVDDADMLARIQQGVGSLLATSPDSEAEIRRVLQERYDSGSLHEETFRSVQSMLDRHITEDVPTSPTDRTLGRKGTPKVRATPKTVARPTVRDEVEVPAGDDAFGTTTVIPHDEVPIALAESRVQVGSLLRDRFLLQEKVAGGSMGVVYKALDRRLAEAEAEEPWVAIKVLSPQLAENVQALRALQQEATKGRCLIHPNIVRFIDMDRDDDLHFLIMEWLEGRTLASILDSADAGCIDHDAAFRIVAQIGDALDYAHRCGIVHADVKPGNIMIMPNGDAKLFDFGVARVRQQKSDTAFNPGVLGALTPAYSSMQVLTGEEPVASDDVFSLACLLYRLVAGHRVFGPRNAAEASQEGMKPQRPQGLSDGQWRALKKALSYARVMRFPSVEEFVSALQSGADDTASLDTSEIVEVEQSAGKGKWIAALIVLLGLAGVAAVQLGVVDLRLDDVIERVQSVVDREPLEPVLPPPDVSPEPVPDATAIESVADTSEPSVELFSEPVIEETPEEPLIDFSTLPPADVEVSFTMGSWAAADFKVRLRENDGPVIVDFVRRGRLGAPLVLKLEEVGFSGNRSPWASRQYTLSDSGIVRFPAGQNRSRITLRMASDSLREADQISTLRLREVDSAESELAVLYVTLEDDDQRAFEAELPVNTIGFASSQASIRETDPAVQIDLVRFNPDSSRVLVPYTVNDVTATEGEDYFAPGDYTISFGPGQRSARLLIPLVQDSRVEGDEIFVVELALPSDLAVKDVHQRVAVMIVDDEPQTR
ncbi:MAG: protein kinase [Gammaproteobacteria bacterium]|nr:protein kinase [Gammaproteobacteria bacterium]